MEISIFVDSTHNIINGNCDIYLISLSAKELFLFSIRKYLSIFLNSQDTFIICILFERRVTLRMNKMEDFVFRQNYCITIC